MAHGAYSRVSGAPHARVKLGSVVYIQWRIKDKGVRIEEHQQVKWNLTNEKTYETKNKERMKKEERKGQVR
jgi:hypothetical protein